MNTKLEQTELQELMKKCEELRGSYARQVTERKMEKYCRDIIDYQQ